jgi:hypothetical protein
MGGNSLQNSRIKAHTHSAPNLTEFESSFGMKVSAVGDYGNSQNSPGMGKKNFPEFV